MLSNCLKHGVATKPKGNVFHLLETIFDQINRKKLRKDNLNLVQRLRYILRTNIFF